jgi:uncharacterized protein (TIGR02246 family)
MRTAVLLLGLVTLIGCATPAPKRPIPVGGIPAEVAAEFQKAVASWNAGDLEGFVAVYADSASFAMPEGFIQGRLAIREFYAPNFAPGAARDELGLESFDVEVLSPEAALVRAVFVNRQRSKVVRRGPSTMVLRRIFDQWRIVHDHSG